MNTKQQILLGPIPDLMMFYYHRSELTKIPLAARMLTFINYHIVARMNHSLSILT